MQWAISTACRGLWLDVHASHLQRCQDCSGQRASAGLRLARQPSGAKEMEHSASRIGPGVVAPGARVEKLAGGFDFTEGPTCDQDGSVFFTDQPNNRILTWSADGRLSTFLQPAG